MRRLVAERTPTAARAEEVAVFAHNDAPFEASLAPDGDVSSFRQLQVENVLCVVAMRSEETGEGGRKLVVDQKLHDARRTT